MSDLPLEPLEHRRYAFWLGASTRIAFVALLLAFAAYASGLVPSAIPVEHVPDVWGKSARDLASASGLAGGASAASWPARAEALSLLAVALLVSTTLPALLAVLPVFRARRERAVFVLCLSQVAIILGAAFAIFLR